MSTRSYTKDEQLARAPSGQSGEAAKDYARGPYGQAGFICSACDCRPCMDDCSAQTIPDTLERKAARAGLSLLAWLQRDQERHGTPFHERYPAHPASDEARAALASASGLSATSAATED